MKGWSSTERRWARSLLGTMLPDGTAPGLESLDVEASLAVLDRAAPPMLRFGFRASVLLLSPLLLIRDRQRRDRWLEGLAHSRFYLMRQLVKTMKLVACMVYFRAPEARARFLEMGP